MQVVWNIPASLRRLTQLRRKRRQPNLLDRRRRRVLRMHSGRSSGFPLDQLRRSQPAGVGGLGRFFLAAHKEPGRPEAQRGPVPVRPRTAVLERAGPTEQACAAVEPRILVGAWVGVGGGPAVLLLSFDRARRLAALVFGRWPGGGGDGAADGRGHRASLPSVAAVPACLRVEGVAGHWLRHARVGRTRRRGALSSIAQGLLV